MRRQHARLLPDGFQHVQDEVGRSIRQVADAPSQVVVTQQEPGLGVGQREARLGGRLRQDLPRGRGTLRRQDGQVDLRHGRADGRGRRDDRRLATATEGQREQQGRNGSSEQVFEVLHRNSLSRRG